MIGYRFVDDHRAEYRVTDLCRVGGVCRSGYYGWLNRGPSKREVADVELLVEIREIYQASRCTYGSPRVWQQLRNRGHNVGRNRVTRLMRINHLVGACAPRRRRNKKPAPCGDLLARDFTAVAPDQRWVTDITEFRCADTKVWLAGVLDLCDRSLVGWSVATHQNTELVVDALTMALARRQPETGLIHHSDHGTQYTSLTFTNRLNEAKLVSSYGSVGDCYDNAATESFWATLKKELHHIHGPPQQYTANSTGDRNGSVMMTGCKYQRSTGGGCLVWHRGCRRVSARRLGRC